MGSVGRIKPVSGTGKCFIVTPFFLGSGLEGGHQDSMLAIFGHLAITEYCQIVAEGWTSNRGLQITAPAK